MTQYKPLLKLVIGEVRRQKTYDRKRMTEKKGISNPSTVLRTGIEQGMLKILRQL